ncbi:glycosyltransferase family 4 protein [Chitinibacteraceae bacterium HSL-7]
MKKSLVYMIGPDPAAQGGMATWAASARGAGLFDALGIVYLASHVDGNPLRKVMRALSCYARLFIACAGGRAALVHLHVATGVSWWRKWGATRIARLFHVPYVLHLHGGTFPSYYAQRQSGLVGRSMRQTLGGAHTLIVLSPDWLPWVHQVAPQSRCKVVPNAVRVPDTASAPGAIRRFAFIGRLSVAKGIEELLRAFAEVRRAHPDVTLELAGMGDVAWTTGLIRELALEECVNLLGWINEVQRDQLLQDVDALILASHKEALPFVILEAMSHARLVVASDVGGVSWVVADGECGFVCQKQSVSSLRDALLEALGDARIAHHKAEKGYQRAREMFSFESLTTQLQEIYGSCTH